MVQFENWPSTSHSQQHRSVLENHVVGYIALNNIYLNATNRGLTGFRPEDFLDDRQWMKLTHVYLAKNNLLKLPDDLFSQLSNLKWLDLRWNDLTTVPQTIKGHRSLKTLLLQNNKIERLPLEIGSLPKLRCLSILNNPLEFPSKSILSQLRTNNELVNYMRLCWQEQSIEMPVNPIGKKANKRRPKKLAPIRKVKDHTEVICRLRNSGKIKDQVMAQKMLHDLELEHKLVQSFKDQDVLKMWRDKYREAQGSGSRGNYRPQRIPSLFQGTTEPFSQRRQIPQNYSIRDINQAINDLTTQMEQTCHVDASGDLADVIKRTEKEIERMNNIRKKIQHLKHHC